MLFVVVLTELIALPLLEDLMKRIIAKKFCDRSSGKSKETVDTELLVLLIQSADRLIQSVNTDGGA